MEILTTPEKKYRIENHQAFVSFIKPVELLIDPVMVNPVTGEIDDDRSLNTELNFWCEVIAPQLIEDIDAVYHTIRSNELCCHIIDLDCGAKTYELLIDRVYKLFMEKYGAYDEIAYSRGLRNREFMYSYSGIEAYISEDMLYRGCLEKDKLFLGDSNNFIKSVERIISAVSKDDTDYVYASIVNGELNTSFDADCVVNYSTKTYKIAQHDMPSVINLNSAIILLSRMFAVKTFEILYDAKSRTTVFHTIEME